MCICREHVYVFVYVYVYRVYRERYRLCCVYHLNESIPLTFLQRALLHRETGEKEKCSKRKKNRASDRPLKVK